MAEVLVYCTACEQRLPKSAFGRGEVVCKECGRRARLAAEREDNAKRKVQGKPPRRVPDGLKRCSRCRKVLPRADFGRNSDMKDGLAVICRDCAREHDRRTRRGDTNRICLRCHELRAEADLPSPHRTCRQCLESDARRCSVCGITKTRAEFGLDRRTPDGFASACRACSNRAKLRPMKRCRRCGHLWPRSAFIGSGLICDECRSAPPLHNAVTSAMADQGGKA